MTGSRRLFLPTGQSEIISCLNQCARKCPSYLCSVITRTSFSLHFFCRFSLLFFFFYFGERAVQCLLFFNIFYKKYFFLKVFFFQNNFLFFFYKFHKTKRLVCLDLIKRNCTECLIPSVWRIH